MLRVPKIKYIMEVLFIIIIIVMMLSTFIPQNQPIRFYMVNYPSVLIKLILFFDLNTFYSSVFHGVAWGIFAFILLLFLILRNFKNNGNLSLHIIIFLITLVVLFDKGFNQTYSLKLEEGESINFGDYINNSSQQYDFDFYLENFTIDYHPESQTPSAFISDVIVKDDTRKTIKVNKPLSVGQYKIYQDTYQTLEQFSVEVDSLVREIQLSEMIEVDSLQLQILGHNKREMQVEVAINGKNYEVVLGTLLIYEGHHVKIDLMEPIFVSGFRITEIFGLKILFVLGILYMMNLGWCFWRES